MILKKGRQVFCIYPDTTHSGIVIFDGKNVTSCWPELENNNLCKLLEKRPCPVMAIEGISSYGMKTKEAIFETVEWIGRFRQAFGFEFTTRIFRKDIEMFLYGTPRTNDSNFRQRILDIFPATGGGKTPQIGIKKQPGPLYGITWRSMGALAIGLTYKYGMHG